MSMSPHATRKHPKLQDLLNLHVVALDVGPRGNTTVAYLAVPKGDPFAGWYTTNFNYVRVYKLAKRAQALIDSYGPQWAHLNARVVRIGDIA